MDSETCIRRLSRRDVLQQGRDKKWRDSRRTAGLFEPGDELLYGKDHHQRPDYAAPAHRLPWPPFTPLSKHLTDQQLRCRRQARKESEKIQKLTSKSQSSILPKTPCFPNPSAVTLGLEIPNATRARNLASSLTSVAASMASIFPSSTRPFLERLSLACRNVTGVFERQKLQ